MDTSFNTSGLLGKSPFSPRSRQNISSRKIMPTSFRKSSRFSVSGKSTQSVQIILSSPYNYVERFGQPLPVLITEALTFADRNTVVSARISKNGYAWVVCGRRLLIWQYRQNLEKFDHISSPHQSRKSVLSSQCFELQLPQSDLAHRAELVSVFLGGGSTNNAPSCIAVSPEGVVRYWPAIVHEGVSVEQHVNLQGQECDSLTDIEGVTGCILATTTCTVLLIQPQLQSGRHALKCKTLKIPTGWLGGIGKRMSSLIFGPISSEQTAETRLVRVLTLPNATSSTAHSDPSWTVYVLADHSLQKWHLTSSSQKNLPNLSSSQQHQQQQQIQDEHLIYVAELNRLVKEHFRRALWENTTSDLNEIDTWLLDIQTDYKDNLIILAAAVNISMSMRVHYAMICLPLTDGAGDSTPQPPPASFKDFLLLKLTDVYIEDSSSGAPVTSASSGRTSAADSDANSGCDFLQYRFLLCGGAASSSSQHYQQQCAVAYLYNRKSITVIKQHEEPDTLEFNVPQDFLLAGSVCVNTPIFFSKIHGLVAVNSTETSLIAQDLNMSATYQNTSQLAGGGETSFNDSLTGSAMVNNLSIYNMDPEEIMSEAYKDTLTQLKAAFIFYVKHQESAYKNILEEIFPSDGKKLPGIDSLLDKLAVMMCQDMLDDIPASDPRWNKDISPVGLGSSYSMQVLHQLEDKQKAMNLFVQFLKESGLWTQLGASTVRNGTLATVYVLGELSEKIVAAIALKSQKCTAALEKAIEKTVLSAAANEDNSDERSVNDGLTFQDLFYRKVTQIYRGIQEFVNHCEDVCHSDLDPSQVAEVVMETDEIVLAVLKAVLKYRQQNSNLFKPQEHIRNIAPDFLPWTSAGGEEGLVDHLVQLHFLTYNYGILLTNNERQRGTLFDQLVALTDILLDGRKCHLESIKSTPNEKILFKQYVVDRQKYMKPFLQEKEWDRAAQLAEKYLDFETLIIICESTDNQHRLDDYLERFQKDGFSEFLYNFYLKENKQGKLIDRCRKRPAAVKSKSHQKLSNFLSDHPQLSWMQLIFDKNYREAAETLKKLGRQEKDSLQRQKTIFSLAKLSKLAAPNETTDSRDFINEVTARLDLIQFQEELPDYVLVHFGYDTTNLKVISPKDLIDLYTCEEYKDAGELEFKKALDLLNFLGNDDGSKEELLLTIWRRALLRDSWNHHGDLDSPLELLQHKLFFRLIDLILMLDHPQLSWMQLIFDKNYREAAETLKKLGRQEKDSLQRQKTIFSLAKLSKLAAPNETTDSRDFINEVTARLDLIQFQEELPDYVLVHFGYDTANLKVISPKDLIDLYTCEEYKEAGELEFKKALDLLNFLGNDDGSKEELLLTIWRRALLRDSWNHHGDLDSPLELLQHKLFFRLIDLILMLDADAASQVPPLDALLEHESMTELRNNKSLRFLLEAGYEHWLR